MKYDSIAGYIIGRNLTDTETYYIQLMALVMMIVGLFLMNYS